MEALGRLFDIGLICPPAATNGAVTGQRVHMTNAGGVTFVLIGGVATNGDDLQIDVQQHTVGTGGTPADLDVVTRAYYKSAVTATNAETWVKHTQAAGSEVAIAASASTDVQQNILCVYVGAEQLSDGYEWVSVNVPDLGTGDKTLTVIAIMHDLKVQRAPENLRALVS